MATTNPTITDVASEPEAPRALADGDTVDVDFALDDEPRSTAPAPAAQVAPPPAPTTEVPRPEPERSQGKRGDLRVALRETRDENKRLRARAEHYRLVAEEAKGSRPRDPGFALRHRVPQLSDTVRQQLVAEADAAASFGAPIDKVLKVMDQHVQRVVSQTEQAFREREIQIRERDFAAMYPDYYDVTRRAGIVHFVALDPATGQPAATYKPTIAKAIVEADNPIEAAYFIAKNMLGEHPEGLAAPEPDETSPVPIAPAPIPAPPAVDVTTAAPRGAPVPNAAPDSGPKPRSVRTLPVASEPRRAILNEDYRKQIDRAWDSRPDEVIRLFDARPDIRKWYEGDAR